ncbi:MAG: SRPBCC family protein [SAR324 cluster bacterium]|nr:SRPBCC family protein [SAR324 cluster bacterium]MCZ6646426.1 SRPBCC family protein [SAR324 cluster bacterium]MCZ6843724.1 SRPBCC family protein [SAR324 cluster bacterium]
MQVTLENSFNLEQPIEKVWAFLSDPTKVAPCLPGAEILEVVSKTEFKGGVKMKLGPFTTQFKGEVIIEHLDDQAHEIRMVGKGKDARGTGSATMVITGKLTELPGGGTEMVSTSELTISGKLAQFGSRMIQDVSKTMFQQFTETFAERLQAETEGREAAPAQADAVSVTELAGAVVKGAMGRIFGKDKN